MSFVKYLILIIIAGSFSIVCCLVLSRPHLARCNEPNPTSELSPELAKGATKNPGGSQQDSAQYKKYVVSDTPVDFNPFLDESIKTRLPSYAQCYLLGEKAYEARDYKLAFEWFSLAVKQLEYISEEEELASSGIMPGTIAAYYLHKQYEFGLGVPENKINAIHFLLLAAHRGYSDAQFDLGLSYLNGSGLEQDYVNAYAWITIASPGFQHTDLLRDTLGFILPNMSTDEFQFAKALSERLKEQYTKRH